MTQYERLYAALEGACRRQRSYVATAQDFADDLTEAFAEYLRCPRRAIALQPEALDTRGAGVTQYASEEAVSLRRDGWLGFRITLQLGPLRHVSFPISFRRSGKSSWAVKLTGAAGEHVIADSLDDADVAFSAWVDLAAAAFETTAEDAVPQRPGAGVEVGFSEGLHAVEDRLSATGA